MKKKFILMLILAFILIIVCGCNKSDTPADAGSETVTPIATLPADISAEEVDHDALDNPEFDPEETIHEPETNLEETTAEKEETTTAAPTVPKTDKFINPLTGLKGTVDMSNKRPIAIMLNNLKPSLPQVGISNADVLYECLVEGGTTRLMAIIMNYESVGVLGSVRSSREYYLDLAQNHDAIYVHAGGSNSAYNNIQSRKINNLDGVNMSLPSTFYRDTERRKTMAVEHTLMTTGEGISSGIAYKKYRNTLKSGFINPFSFNSPDKPVSLTGGTAKHVLIPYNNYQFPQYIYSTKTKQYDRYQFNGLKHIDGATGKQLKFDNLLILVCKHSYTGDDKGHINIYTTGNGKGYYVNGGKYNEIKWSKSSVDTPMVLTNTDGTPLVMNAGKMAVNIISSEVDKALILNYSAK